MGSFWRLWMARVALTLRAAISEIVVLTLGASRAMVRPAYLAAIIATIVPISILLMQHASRATVGTRYVATTGSDTSNDCTVQVTPCATINHAISQANSGDTIMVA